MSAGAFRCGHPKLPENIKIIAGGHARCRTCQNACNRAYKRRDYATMTPAEKWIAYRVRHLPKQIEAARRKVAALENEARRYGMNDLIGGQS